MGEIDELDQGERPTTLSGIDEAIHACRRCPIGLLDNQAVMGEGPRKAPLMAGVVAFTTVASAATIPLLLAAFRFL